MKGMKAKRGKPPGAGKPKDWLAGLLVVALLVTMILVGVYGYSQGALVRNLAQEAATLKEHNDRLIKRLDIMQADLADAMATAALVDEYPSRFAASMAEARNWLDHAEMALDELDRVAPKYAQRGRINELSIIARDIRAAIQEANALLPDEEAAGIARAIEEQAKIRSIDPLLLTAMMLVESNGRPNVRGKSGEYGLLQIMPSTGRWIAGRLGYEDWQPSDMLDPGLNIEFAAYYLAAVTKDLGGDVWTGVLAYNAGPSGAKKWLKKHGNEVDKHSYVCKVKREYDKLRGANYG